MQCPIQYLLKMCYLMDILGLYGFYEDWCLVSTKLNAQQYPFAETTGFKESFVQKYKNKTWNLEPKLP